MSQPDMPTVGQILRHWVSALPLLDWGEPECWACGDSWGGRFTADASATWKELAALWKRAPLQRCHIVPRSLGGSDEPENLFLLCLPCHDHAPNTPSRELFLRWVTAQRGRKRFARELRDACEDLGMKEEDCRNALPLLSDSELAMGWLSQHTGLHLNQELSGGARLNPATIAAAFLLYARR